MEQRILIDMKRLREIMSEDPAISLPEGLYYLTANENGLKSVRELAVFRFTCRRCEDAPCINVCPADALEKDEDGIISRHTNLCISCKSCVIICPFGTMMTDFFQHHREKSLFYDLTDEAELMKFVDACPAGTISLVDGGESPDENIYALNEKILIKDFVYTA